MSTFTMTLSEIMAVHNVDDIDTATTEAHVFGLDKYPIFDEAYRHHLNRKIIARFWNREIGQETDEMFRMRMDTRMREIMVEKNQRYLSERFKFDPMVTIDIATVINETGSGTLNGTTTTNTDSTEQTDVDTDSTSTKEAKSRAVSSVMPQNQLSGNGDYADSAQDSVSNGADTNHTETGSTTTGSADQTAATDSNTTDQRDRTSTTKGMQALPSQLLAQYRDTILNIDLEILTDLERLFMSVTSNGDEVFYNQGQGYYYPYLNGFGFF